MTSSAPSQGNTPGRTFMVTIWTVACLVAVQVLLIGWSILQKPPSQHDTGPAQPPSADAYLFSPTAPPQQAAVDPSEGVLGRYVPPVGIGGTSVAGPAAPPVFVLPPGRLIDDPTVLEAIDKGIRLRSAGDMLEAIASLRKADSMQPDHPAILHELALTYRQMGLEDRADEYISRILAMGDSGAGDYFAVWDMWMRGLSGGPGNGMNRSRVPVRAMQLGPIEALRDPAVTQGEKIVLRVPIEADPRAAIDPPSVEVFVYFYDLVDGRRVEQTTADEPTFLFITSPVDWTPPDHNETLEVVYFHPQLTPEQIRELGQRRFYGYVVKLFYQDELQDLVADPPSLADQAPQLPPIGDQGPASSLFP